MTRLRTLLALAAAAVLVAACAAKKVETEPAPAAEVAPAAAFDPSLLPSAGAKPILLSSETMPGDDLGGGTLEQGTVVTGKDGWAVHGESEGVAWRYGSSDAGQLRVAGEPNIEWQYIQVAQSWGIKCAADGDKTPCTLLRIAPVEPGTMTTGGLALDEHLTCVRAANTSEAAAVSVDGGTAVILNPPSLCVGGAESDALQQQMLAGQTVNVQANFAPKGPTQTMTLPTHGLKQALALRSWIVEQYKAGKLNAVD